MRLFLRVGGVIAVGAALSVACTFMRNLDYLQDGANDAGSTSSSGMTTSSTSSSGGSEAGVVGQLLVPTLLNPANLIQDDANLYWSTDDNKVMRVAKTGGPPKELAKLSGDVGAITGLTIDPQGGTLFLLTDGSVKTLSREGGTPANFLPGPDVLGIVADDTFLFTVSSDATGGAVFRRYPKANAAQPTVISPPPNANETPGGAVAVFKDSVYWTVTDVDAVGLLYEQPKNVNAGVAPKVWKHTGINAADKSAVGVNVTKNEGLAVDDDGVYWIDETNLVPYRLLRTQMQADAPALLNTQTSQSTAITVDAKYIYVLDGKNLIRISKANTDQREIYAAVDTSTEILNDGAALYYLFTGDGVKATGGIYKLPKP